MGKQKTLLDIAEKLYNLQTRFKRLKSTDFKSKGQKATFQVAKRRFNLLVDNMHELYEKGSSNVGFRG